MNLVNFSENRYSEKFQVHKTRAHVKHRFLYKFLSTGGLQNEFGTLFIKSIF